MQKKSFRFGKKVCIGSTLNLGVCPKFWGNSEGIWGNPGEIPHIGRKTHGVYRVNIHKKCCFMNIRRKIVKNTFSFKCSNPEVVLRLVGMLRS